MDAEWIGLGIAVVCQIATIAYFAGRLRSSNAATSKRVEKVETDVEAVAERLRLAELMLTKTGESVHFVRNTLTPAILKDMEAQQLFERGIIVRVAMLEERLRGKRGDATPRGD